jgi:hypothetical protein
MAILPIMPRRVPSPVALAIGPVGMAAIGRIAIATVAMAIGRAVMAATG